MHDSLLALVRAALMSAATFTFIAGCSQKGDVPVPGGDGKPSQEETAATELLKLAVKKELKDPESAQFRDLRYFAHHAVIPDGRKFGITYSLCGQINAKNSFGGYVGFKRFVSTVTMSNGNTYSTIESEINRDSFEKLVIDECENKNTAISEKS